MLIIAFLICLLLFLGIPIALLMSAGISYAGGMEISQAVGRCMLAFIVYFFVTAIILTVLIMLNFYSNPESYKSAETFKEITSLFIIFGYAVAGWLLCSFINGKLINSWTHFSLGHGKPQSIFKS